MSYRAKVYDNTTGAFLLECRVTGQSLAEAESRAIAKAALQVRGNPAEMDVRRLDEMQDAVPGSWFMVHGCDGEVAL